MDKKKIVFWVIVIAIGVLLFPRLYILATSAWIYHQTETICVGRDPTPPMGRGEQFPVPLYEVRPYTVITSRGYMYPGDEYDVPGEGSWYGMITLLFAGKDGATFLVFYPINDPIKGYLRVTCRWFVPVGDYR